MPSLVLDIRTTGVGQAVQGALTLRDAVLLTSRAQDEQADSADRLAASLRSLAAAQTSVPRVPAAGGYPLPAAPAPSPGATSHHMVPGSTPASAAPTPAPTPAVLLNQQPVVLALQQLTAVNRAGFAQLAAAQAGAPAPLSPVLPAGPRLTTAAGPAARLQAAQQQLQQAQAGNDPNALFDAQFRVARAQQAYARAQNVVNPQPPSFWQRFMEFAGTSRFNLGRVGGVEISPLVNRLGQLVAPRAAAGGLAGGAAGAVAGGLAGGAAGAGVGLALVGSFVLATAAVKTLADITTAAAERLQDLARVSTETGGTMREVAQLQALGVGGAQGAQLANSLRERLASDPRALLGSAQLGMAPSPNILTGSQDNARVLRDHLLALRQVRNAEEQLRLARMLGLESALDLLRVSDRAFAAQLRDADTQARIADPQATQQARDFGAEISRIGQTAQMVGNALGKPFLEAGTVIAGFIADNLLVLAENLNTFAPVFKFVIDTLMLPLRMVADLTRFLTAGDHNQDLRDAQDANTKALQANTAAIREGQFGPGSRGRNAVPGELRGQMLQHAIAGNTMRLGAFAP